MRTKFLTEGLRALERSRLNWVNNIKIPPKIIGWKGVN
jgi:hypothetical protein